ncbi:MAG TPA: CsbD family protein [Oligella sp.]|nr:CsbD family protein [Oligella sp.]
MNTDIIKGNWKEVMGKAKQQWGKLTDDDLQQIDGKREELIGKIQKEYGYARDQAEEEVRKWEDSY